MYLAIDLRALPIAQCHLRRSAYIQRQESGEVRPSIRLDQGLLSLVFVDGKFDIRASGLTLQVMSNHTPNVPWTSNQLR